MNIVLIILAYLLGSISSAVIVCKFMRLENPSTRGSNNPGTTNVLRLYGKKAAVVTLSGDVLKGFIPVVIGRWLQAPDIVIASIGLVAFVGHLYPIFFNFQGGKGVATLIGVLFGACWLLGLAFVVTWLLIAFLFRYSSLAGLTAAATTPIYTAFVMSSHLFIISNMLMALLIFWRHTTNIKNLISGKEKKIHTR